MDDKKYLKTVKDRADEMRRTAVSSRGIVAPIKRSDVLWLLSQFDNLYVLHESDHDLSNKWRLQRDKAELQAEQLLNLLRSLHFWIQFPNGEYKDTELFQMVSEAIKHGIEKRPTR